MSESYLILNPQGKSSTTLIQLWDLIWPKHILFLLLSKSSFLESVRTCLTSSFSIFPLPTDPNNLAPKINLSILKASYQWSRDLAHKSYLLLDRLWLQASITGLLICPRPHFLALSSRSVISSTSLSVSWAWIPGLETCWEHLSRPGDFALILITPSPFFSSQGLGTHCWSETDCQIFLQQRCVYVGSAENYSSGEPCASPHRAREVEHFYRGKNGQ